MHHKEHGAMTASTKATALSAKVASSGGLHNDVSRFTLLDLLVDIEARNEEGMGDIVRDQP